MINLFGPREKFSDDIQMGPNFAGFAKQVFRDMNGGAVAVINSETMEHLRTLNRVLCHVFP